MTIETVLIDVISEVGLNIDSPQITSTEYDVKQIKSFMTKAGKDIISRTEWPNLNASETIAGALSEKVLPSDFQEMSERGSVILNKAAYTPVLPVVSPEVWSFILKYQPDQLYYRLSAGSIEFSGTLDSDGANYGYQSNKWIHDGSAYVDSIAQNSDTVAFPEHLLTMNVIWRWLRQKGLPYEDYISEYEAELVMAIEAVRGV